MTREKTALVTGVSPGIGRATATLLSGRGFRVFGTMRRPNELIGYRASVLNALEEVQNALVNYSQEQERRDRLNQAAQQSQVAVDLATEQYRAGLVDFLSVLDAQRELYAEEDQTTVTIDCHHALSRSRRRLECSP